MRCSVNTRLLCAAVVLGLLGASAAIAATCPQPTTYDGFEIPAYSETPDPGEPFYDVNAKLQELEQIGGCPPVGSCANEIKILRALAAIMKAKPG